jgi:hypothetical protein
VCLNRHEKKGCHYGKAEDQHSIDMLSGILNIDKRYKKHTHDKCSYEKAHHTMALSENNSDIQKTVEHQNQ